MGYDDINKNILTSQIKGTVYATHALGILVHVHEKNPYLQIHFSKTNIIIDNIPKNSTLREKQES